MRDAPAASQYKSPVSLPVDSTECWADQQRGQGARQVYPTIKAPEGPRPGALSTLRSAPGYVAVSALRGKPPPGRPVGPACPPAANDCRTPPLVKNGWSAGRALFPARQRLGSPRTASCPPTTGDDPALTRPVPGEASELFTAFLSGPARGQFTREPASVSGSRVPSRGAPGVPVAPVASPLLVPRAPFSQLPGVGRLLG